jgi:hypothetical protein
VKERQKRLGIKYCGGCNPTYERVEWVQRLQSLMGERLGSLPHDEIELDATLVVCGCPKACTAEGVVSSGVPVLVVTSETDLEEVSRWLTQLAGRS